MLGDSAGLCGDRGGRALKLPNQISKGSVKNPILKKKKGGEEIKEDT